MRVLTRIATALVVLLASTSVAVVAQAAGGRGTVWRVTQATHTSSADYRSPDASGSASMRWHLAKPTPSAPNRMTVGAPGRFVAGYGVVNIAGDVAARSTTERGSCEMAAATGSTRYPYDLPGPVTLNLSAHPQGGLQVALSARYATLGSGSFGSECLLRGTRPPLDPVTKVTRIKASALRKKTLTLRYAGTSRGEFDTYSWSTRIVLKRR